MNNKQSSRPDTLPRIVVITGVSRGLGRAMAEEFIRLGHVVIGCGRSEPDIRELRTTQGMLHRFDVVDVSDDTNVMKWTADVLQTHDVPDLLVNNAATINPNAPLWKVKADIFDRVIDVNIKGVANVLRHFLPAMIDARSGVIVNFSSGWGRGTAAGVGPYCASKWAIEGMTRALAQDLPKGLVAVPLNPGIIDTNMLRSAFGDEAGQYPTADKWAKGAVPFILKIGTKDNGKPLTVP
jgi:NAD(P)-dependent dehydrogenase (short-subunit alcohol dehydrogenase family)